VDQSSPNCFHSGKIVVHNAVFHFSIASSVPEIFAIKVQSCPKSSALLITHELKNQGYMSFCVFVCMMMRLPADST